MRLCSHAPSDSPSPTTMALAMVLVLAVVLVGGCKEPESPVRHEPMRQAPPGAAALESPPPPPPTETAEPTPAEEPEDERVPLAERAPADPAIERALDLIATSGHSFVDQAPPEADEKPSIYTAEQFASMLRTKWDWIGYDITEIDPWLEEIAARSFKTNLPYLVEIEGQDPPVELRTWLDPQLTADP